MVGHPVRQTKSPHNFNVWFERRALDIAMIAMDVSPAQIEPLVMLMRGWHNLRGCVVTVPHKQAFAGLVDTLTPRARALGAVNVVRRGAGWAAGWRHGGRLWFHAARRVRMASPVNGAKALVVESVGGAGGAITYALCEAGAARAASDGHRCRAGATGCCSCCRPTSPRSDLGTDCASLAGLDLVVNATPIGMSGNAQMPLAQTLLDTLAPGTLVADVVTSPEITPLLAAAKANGNRIQAGSEMAHGQLEHLGAFLGVMPATGR